MMRFLLVLLFVAACQAHAHKPSDSYLSLTVANAEIVGQWDIALRDFDYAIGLDANGDAQITWGEVRSKHQEIAAYALARLALQGDGGPCNAEVTDHLIDGHTDGAYAVLRFTARCERSVEKLGLRYSLLFDVDPQHKGLLRLEYQGQSSTAVFTPETASQTFTMTQHSKWRQFLDYCLEGVWHIWIGFDHILFLLALLLPAVVLRERKQWQGVATFRPALIQVLKIVTAFTLAHSITLSLAALSVVALPSRFVESVIAASVVAAALNNLFPLFQEKRWAMAFGFGLLHGFGFASVLGDLGLPQDSRLLALVGFNVGVELGQLAIVAVFLPLAFVLRRTIFYRRAALFGGSLAIALLAFGWFVERAFNLKFLPI